MQAAGRSIAVKSAITPGQSILLGTWMRLVPRNLTIFGLHDHMSLKPCFSVGSEFLRQNLGFIAQIGVARRVHSFTLGWWGSCILVPGAGEFPRQMKGQR